MRVTNAQLCWLVLLMVFTSVSSSLGLPLPSANSQVDSESWTFKDGAPANIRCLAQANDGFLWLCSHKGLVRFDGTRFEPFRSPFGDQLLSAKAHSLFAPRSGGLWVGYTLDGFSFLDNGRVTNYAIETGSVYGFAQDRDGIVWAGTSSGLWRFDHSAWQHIGVEWNAPAGLARQLGFDLQGTLWVLVGNLTNPKDLVYLMPGTRQFKTAQHNLSAFHFSFDADRHVLSDPTNPPIADSARGSVERTPAYPLLTNAVQFTDRNNSLWTAPADKPIVMRLPREGLHDAANTGPTSRAETYDINPFEMATLVDREGNVWFADPKGIYRFFYTPVIRQRLPTEALESSNFAVVPDDNGAVWIGFTNSQAGYSDLYHVSAGKAERHLPPVTAVAYRAPDRTIWFSGEGCLWHVVGHEFVRVDLPPEMVMQSQFLETMTEDQHGGLWVSFGRHGLYRLADGIWTPYGGRTDLPTGTMMMAFTDSLGRVWFGYINNQLAVLDGDGVRVFGPSDGLRVGAILSISGRGSEIWVGGEFGLEQFDHGHFHDISAVDDELLSGISGIVETPDGDLWLNGSSGIFHIRKVEIAQALKDSSRRVNGEHFGRREGLPGVSSQVRPLPTAVEGTDGRLWFTLTNGIVWIDPATHSEKRSVPPPVVIQSIAADEKSYSPSPRLSLPAHTSSIQISYSAVSLSDPEIIRFRYRLQETDNDWHEVATSSPVNYRNLPPGTYHFDVSASDTNGAWSDRIASAEFTVLPIFYQTLWFRSLCVILLLAILAVLYQLHLRRLARQYDMRIEERVSERTRIARELHDTLLQSFQGLLLRFQVAYELLPASPAEAKQDLGCAIDRTVRAIDEGRTAVQGLRASAVNDADLIEAIKTLVEELASDQVVFRVSLQGSARPLRPVACDEIYHIAGEALSNSRRHAQASQIEVELYYDPHRLRLRVRDNGKGIEPQFLKGESTRGHYGLPGMRERARLLGGQLNVWSAPASGTEIELTVPAARAYAAKRSKLLGALLRTRQSSRD